MEYVSQERSFFESGNIVIFPCKTDKCGMVTHSVINVIIMGYYIVKRRYIVP